MAFLKKWTALASVLLYSGFLATFCEAQTAVTVSVNPGGTTTAVGPNFVSFSMVLDETSKFMGTAANPNLKFEQLVRNIAHYSNGPFQIRELYEQATGGSTTTNLATLSHFYSDMQLAGTPTVSQNMNFIVGVDFKNAFTTTGAENTGNGGTDAAATQAALIVSDLPAGSVSSFEVGNEPDLYPGLTTPARNANIWNYTEYKREYDVLVPKIVAKNTGVKMDAPVFSGNNKTGFDSNAATFYNAEASNISLFNMHFYPGTCNHGLAADYLLTADAVNPSSGRSAQPNKMAAMIAPMSPKPIVRIGEMNSIACGGQDQVSNTFQSALWFLDTAMQYAYAGVSGVNVFTSIGTNVPSTAYYSPFLFQINTDGTIKTPYAIDSINPIYYGMLATSLMFQNNAALLPLPSVSPANTVLAYATKDSSGAVRLLLINKDKTTTYNASFSLAGYSGSASTWPLVITNNGVTNANYAGSDSDSAGDTILLGGQTFKGSSLGDIQGTLSLPTKSPVNGIYTISVPPISAAIVKVAN